MYAVSYTHLDVYKRQPFPRSKSGNAYLLVCVDEMCIRDSYTHTAILCESDYLYRRNIFLIEYLFIDSQEETK